MLIAIVIGAPFVPTNPATAKHMIELLQLKKGQKLYDLGSGDGRLLHLAAQQGVHAVGIEMNLYAVIWATLMGYLKKSASHVSVKWGNYWNIPIKDADAVVIFGLPHLMPRFAQKFKAELRSGTKVVSNSFQIPGLKLVKHETVGKDNIYLYTV